ncbi:MAG TPA: transposase [Terriglobales bacterium]|nr:transposase [Terriglobales bacterium]
MKASTEQSQGTQGRNADVPNSSAGVPPAVAGASRPRFGEVTIRDRGHLPHWEKDAATYFITFRLADSLPKSVLDRIESERQAIVGTANQMHRALSPDERKKLQRLSSPIIEQYLDSGAGACPLQNPLVAEEVALTLCHFHGKRYRLIARCVMPNHVHVVVKLFPGQALAAVVHSWKSFTAKQANRILGRQGAFWQREYYDHLIRGEAELERAIGYVAENPEKASLKSWKWVWVCGRDARTTAAEDGGATKPKP